MTTAEQATVDAIVDQLVDEETAAEFLATPYLERGTAVQVAYDARTWSDEPADIAGEVGVVVNQISAEQVRVSVGGSANYQQVVRRCDLVAMVVVY